MTRYRINLVDYVEASSEEEAIKLALDRHEGVGVTGVEPCAVDVKAAVDKARKAAAHGLERWRAGEKLAAGLTPCSAFELLDLMHGYFVAANRRGQS
jgi:hypothetical protein